MKEDVFSQTFAIGAVRSVSLEVRDGNALICFMLLDGSRGMVHTKRGGPKEYRIETALRLLRSLGVSSLSVDLSGWQLGQKELL